MRKVWVFGVLVLMLVSMLTVPVSAGEARSRKFTIVFKGESLPEDALERVKEAGGKVVSAVPEIGMIQAEGTPAMMKALQKLPQVQAVAPSLIWELQIERSKVRELTAPDTVLAAPGDLYRRYQWDIRQVTMDGASWNVNGGSHRTVVGIIDTGVNAGHRDLAANFLGGRNFVPAGANGDPTETGDPNDTNDRFGHGSHVAGAVAGNGRIYGVGPNLGYRAYRVFGRSGGAYTSWITAAIVSAANDGVDVMSMSLGGYDVLGKVTWTDPDTGITYDLGDDHADFLAWVSAVKYAVKKGVVVVAAAGNDGINAGNTKAVIDFLNAAYGPLGYHFKGAGIEVPAGVPGAIGVSATGQDSTLASYSNYGSGFVDVSAPGGDFKRYPTGDWYTDMCLSAYKDPGDGRSLYAWMAGTSMATPKVSAVAALYIDQYRTENDGRRPKPGETKEHVEETSRDLGKKGYDRYFGFGMVNAFDVLQDD